MAQKKKPAIMKVLKTQTRDKINTPQLPLGMPPAPSNLKDSELKYYIEYANQFNAMKILTQVDAQSVANLAIQTALRDELQSEIAAHGLMYTSTGRNGIQRKMNPAVNELAKVMNTMRLLMAEFGLTPSSRTKIQTEDNKQTELFPGLTTVAK